MEQRALNKWDALLGQPPRMEKSILRHELVRLARQTTPAARAVRLTDTTLRGGNGKLEDQLGLALLADKY
jgi:hypothetical protein